MKNKLSKGLSLSLSANPKCMIKGAFFAVTEVFADFYNKISKFYNTFKLSFFRVNNHTLSRSYLDLSAANSPSIQYKISISLKRKVFSGSSTNWLTPKVKDDIGIVDALTENSNSVRECDGISSLVYKRSTRAEKSLANDVQCGRSMIEMLGVLAIIAVLSVGGIAGYSKAMEKWKINKMQEEYSYLLIGLLEHITEIKQMNATMSQVGLVDFVQAAHLVPETWIKNRNDVNFQMKDTYGNIIQIFARRNNLAIDFYLGGFSKDEKGVAASRSFSSKVCSTLLQNVVIPLHYSLYYTSITGGNGVLFYGDSYCNGSNKKCFAQVTLSNIKTACSSCRVNQFCGITIEF